MDSAHADRGTPLPTQSDETLPAFLQRRADAPAGGEPAPGEDPTTSSSDKTSSGEVGDDFEDPAPAHVVARQAERESTREQERALERDASGAAADDVLGKNGKPLIVGDVALVTYGAGAKAHDKTGTLLAIEPPSARVRLNGSKAHLGELVPIARVETAPVNGGKPIKGKPAQKAAAHHALHMTEYREALAAGPKPVAGKKGRTSDGFEHAHRAAEEETAPLPKRLLKGNNDSISELTIYRHLGVIRAAKEKVASATGELREKLKKAKDDGVNPKMLSQIMSDLKKAPEELIDEQNTLSHYRDAVHLPTAGRIDPLGEEDRDTIEKRKAYAKEAGLRAGYRGADASSNPYPDPTDPCHNVWADGWREAQNNLASRFKVLKD